MKFQKKSKIEAPNVQHLAYAYAEHMHKFLAKNFTVIHDRLGASPYTISLHTNHHKNELNGPDIVCWPPTWSMHGP